MRGSIGFLDKDIVSSWAAVQWRVVTSGLPSQPLFSVGDRRGGCTTCARFALCARFCTHYLKM